MVEGSKRNRTLRRVKIKTPGGKTVTHYRNRKPGKQQCKSCGSILHGVPHVSRTKLRGMTKSKKRPTRPFGGVLCGRCLRQKIEDAVL